jgi:hypothetical protein
MDARAALLEAIAGTGNSLREENHVFVLIAGDLTSRQRDVLVHQHSDFRSRSNQSKVELASQLEMWTRGDRGFAAIIIGSLNAERFTLDCRH